MSKLYLLGKLSEINYRIATHERDANGRLASEAYKILLLPTPDIPGKYRGQYQELLNRIEKTLKEIAHPGITPSSIHHIRNSTAVKYIKLLIDIQNELESNYREI